MRTSNPLVVTCMTLLAGALSFACTIPGAERGGEMSMGPQPEIPIGTEAPDFTGTDVNGKTMKLSDFRGKVVVLDFFGDW